MGFCSSKQPLPQILVLGLQSSGKTAFVYGDRFDNFDPTTGFNYEERSLRGILKVGMWDAGGKKSLRVLWPSFYRNINFSAIVFIIDADKDEYFPEARRELNILVNEEELRECAFLIVFNEKGETAHEIGHLSGSLGLELIHPSIKLKAFLIDLLVDDPYEGEYEKALKWLTEQIVNKRYQ